MKVFAMGVLLLDLSPEPRKLIIASRLWGLYLHFEDAEKAVINNLGDIFENYYNVACIEEHGLINYQEPKDSARLFEGEYQVPKQWWYKSSFAGSNNPIIISMGEKIPVGMENTSNIWIG